VRAAEAVRERVLDCFAPDLEELRQDDAELFARTRAIAERAAAAPAQALVASSEGAAQWVSQLQRAQLVFELNAHALSNGRVNLYYWGSKMAHSCRPNAALRVRESDGRAFVQALCEVSPGEAVTIDYLGLDTLQSTPQRRRQLLRSKRFWCGCSRCSLEPDLARPLPCPACCAEDRGGAEEDFALDVSAIAKHKLGELGLLFAAPVGGGSPSTEAWSWRCRKCGRQYAGNEPGLAEVLRLETRLCDAVVAATRPEARPLADELLTLERACRRVLSPLHWASKRAELGALRALCGVEPPPEGAELWLALTLVDNLWNWVSGQLAPSVREPALVLAPLLSAAADAAARCEQTHSNAVRLYRLALGALECFAGHDAPETARVRNALRALGAGDRSFCQRCEGAATQDGAPLLACARCGQVFYCSRACQEAHWKAKEGGHKAVCRAATS
jgi:hypothetical protein